MGYLHIENLYRSQDILMFRECYALEKIHGTSAHISWRDGTLTFSPGGVSAVSFAALFDREALANALAPLGASVTVYGEAYGGSCQKMGETYGKSLRFIVFDVMIGETWLAVPDMADVAKGLGLEVVAWEKIPATVEAMDAIRDAPSVQAERNGMGGDKRREGVVLRPLIELTLSNGSRVIAKHRLEMFSERATPQRIVDAAMLEVLAQADAIATEWVTPNRLTHVLDKIPGPHEMRHVPAVIKAMVEDVYREAKGEIVESKEAERAISKRAAALFKARVTAVG